MPHVCVGLQVTTLVDTVPIDGMRGLTAPDLRYDDTHLKLMSLKQQHP